MKTEEDWHASPKKQKPLKVKLESLSKKIHEAQYAVRDEKEQVIGFVSFELYHRIRAQERSKAIDECIEEMKRFCLALYAHGLTAAPEEIGRALEKLKLRLNLKKINYENWNRINYRRTH